MLLSQGIQAPVPLVFINHHLSGLLSSWTVTGTQINSEGIWASFTGGDTKMWSKVWRQTVKIDFIMLFFEPLSCTVQTVQTAGGYGGIFVPALVCSWSKTLDGIISGCWGGGIGLRSTPVLLRCCSYHRSEADPNSEYVQINRWIKPCAGTLTFSFRWQNSQSGI